VTKITQVARITQPHEARSNLSRLGAWRDRCILTIPCGDRHNARCGSAPSFTTRNRKSLPRLKHTQPDAVRGVILRQTPNPTPGHAHGFGLSAPRRHQTTAPLAVPNIFKEMTDDLGPVAHLPTCGFGRNQGVPALNTT